MVYVVSSFTGMLVFNIGHAKMEAKSAVTSLFFLIQIIVVDQVSS